MENENPDDINVTIPPMLQIEEFKSGSPSYLEGFRDLQNSFKNPNSELSKILPSHVTESKLALKTFNQLLWDLYYPTCKYLISKKSSLTKGATIVGVLGVQGTGKSFLSGILQGILEIFFKKKTIKFSSDDFYLTYEERKKLQEIHPFLKFRGPPGTHDIDRLFNVIQKLKEGGEEEVKIPIFDKSLHNGQGDRSGYLSVPSPSDIDFCIFEGWFNGIMPLNKSSYNSELAKFSDENLKKYQNWDFLDNFVVIKPDDFKHSYTWRQEAETRQGKGLSEAEIVKFVDYFFESINPDEYYPHLLEHHKDKVDILVEVDKQRLIKSIKFL